MRNVITWFLIILLPTSIGIWSGYHVGYRHGVEAMTKIGVELVWKACYEQAIVSTRQVSR